MAINRPTVSDCEHALHHLMSAHNKLQHVKDTYTFSEVQKGLKGVTLQYGKLAQLITQIQTSSGPNFGYCWDVDEIDKRLRVLRVSKEHLDELVSVLNYTGPSSEEVGAKKNSLLARVDQQLRDCRQTLMVVEQKLHLVYDFLHAYYGKHSPHRKDLERDSAVLRPKKKKGFLNKWFRT